MKKIFKKTEKVIDAEKLEKRKERKAKAKQILIKVGKTVAFVAGGAACVLVALAATGSVDVSNVIPSSEAPEVEETTTDEETPIEETAEE